MSNYEYAVYKSNVLFRQKSRRWVVLERTTHCRDFFVRGIIVCLILQCSEVNLMSEGDRFGFDEEKTWMGVSLPNLSSKVVRCGAK